jgi:predicted dehydrogenase
MTRPVRIALFGNSFAEKVLLPALNHVGSQDGAALEVVGIAGRDGDKAAATAQAWKIPRATDNWPELFDLEPDLSIIATPVDLHFDMVQNALELGSAVLCEKPFALDVAQAEELAQLAQGRLALIDHQLRWNPYRRKLRELLQDSFIGEILHARCDMVLDSPAFLRRPHSWWFDEARGGGVLGALGSHVIDGIQWLLGPVSAVSARLTTCVKERPDGAGVPRAVTADDLAELWLELESGARVSLTTSVCLPGAARWLTEISGSRGTLRLGMEDELLGGVHGEELEAIEVEGVLPDPGALGMKASGPFSALSPPYLLDIVRAVAAGRTEVPEAATFEDGVACMRVLEAARRSSRHGGALVACR